VSVREMPAGGAMQVPGRVVRLDRSAYVVEATGQCRSRDEPAMEGRAAAVRSKQAHLTATDTTAYVGVSCSVAPRRTLLREMAGSSM
jgi:hypothetical protein